MVGGFHTTLLQRADQEAARGSEALFQERVPAQGNEPTQKPTAYFQDTLIYQGGNLGGC